MMAEKGYFTVQDECGVINISQEVIAGMASIACQETEGVASMAGIADSTVKGIVFTTNEEGECSLEAHIIVKMGNVVSDVAMAAQAGIKNAVESTAGVTLKAVNVFVAGIALK